MRAPAKEWDDGMGLTNGGQLTGLFLSCGLGFLLGLYYDGFRVARLVMRSSKRVIFFQDLFFFPLFMSRSWSSSRAWLAKSKAWASS